MADDEPIHPMTRDQAEALQAYVWEIRDMLRLRHWDVFLAAEQAEDDANASVHPTPGKFVAGIRLAEHWFDRTPEDQRNDIVHELLHLVHRDQAEVIRCGLQDSGYLPAKAFALLWRLFELHTEAMVDHLAGVLAPVMPLPDLPT